MLTVVLLVLAFRLGEQRQRRQLEAVLLAAGAPGGRLRLRGRRRHAALGRHRLLFVLFADIGRLKGIGRRRRPCRIVIEPAEARLDAHVVVAVFRPRQIFGRPGAPDQEAANEADQRAGSGGRRGRRRAPAASGGPRPRLPRRILRRRTHPRHRRCRSSSNSVSSTVTRRAARTAGIASAGAALLCQISPQACSIRGNGRGGRDGAGDDGAEAFRRRADEEGRDAQEQVADGAAEPGGQRPARREPGSWPGRASPSAYRRPRLPRSSGRGGSAARRQRARPTQPAAAARARRQDREAGSAGRRRWRRGSRGRLRAA